MGCTALKAARPSGVAMTLSMAQERKLILPLLHYAALLSSDFALALATLAQAGANASLRLTVGFVGGKEERPIPADGSTEVTAELVALEGRVGRGTGDEKIFGVEVFVAEVLERLAVEIVRAGTRGNVHNRPAVAPVLGAEG